MQEKLRHPLVGSVTTVERRHGDRLESKGRDNLSHYFSGSSGQGCSFVNAVCSSSQRFPSEEEKLKWSDPDDQQQQQHTQNEENFFPTLSGSGTTSFQPLISTGLEWQHARLQLDINFISADQIVWNYLAIRWNVTSVYRCGVCDGCITAATHL